MRNLEQNTMSHYTNVSVHLDIEHCAIGSHSSQPSTYDIQCANPSMLLLGRGSLCGIIVEASDCCFM